MNRLHTLTLKRAEQKTFPVSDEIMQKVDRVNGKNSAESAITSNSTTRRLTRQDV